MNKAELIARFEESTGKQAIPETEEGDYYSGYFTNFLIDTVIAELQKENEAWKEKAKIWLSSPDAMKKLDGYREQASQLCTLHEKYVNLKLESEGSE